MLRQRATALVGWSFWIYRDIDVSEGDVAFLDIVWHDNIVLSDDDKVPVAFQLIRGQWALDIALCLNLGPCKEIANVSTLALLPFSQYEPVDVAG